MIRAPSRALLVLLLAGLLAACSPAPQPRATYDPAMLRFSGERALAIETEFVTQFPLRHSGQPNNRLAAEWLQAEFTRLGWACRMDEWEVINYSRPLSLRNVVCQLPGASPRELLVVAHHDQSPDTIQGADNDGSGIAILLALAEIFAAESQRPYTLTFVAADGEEYGMLGSRRYIQTHSNTRQIIAGVSLDNLGKEFFNGLDMDARGQFRNYGALWLQLTAQAAARQAGDGTWVPQVVSPVDQALGQAVPMSFMDEGPLVAAGVPAFGLAGHVPPEFGELHWATYHSPDDTLEYQSAGTLHHAGRATEALLRQLLSMPAFPTESGPYLYFEASGQVLRGWPLMAIFVGVVTVFFLGSWRAYTRPREDSGSWKAAGLHFLSLWLPWVASVVSLYVFVAVGLMDNYHLYPATAKDEPLFEPKWPAVILYLAGLGVWLWLGRALARRAAGDRPAPAPAQLKTVALFVVGLGGTFILAANPFSLLLMLPMVGWCLISARRGTAWGRDLALFLAGGSVVFVLLCFFGVLILRNNLAVLWYLMMLFSIGVVDFPMASVIAALLAAGLMLVVPPPQAVTRRL